MNLEHAMQILTAEEFTEMVEAAYEEGPDDMRSFRVENIRTTANVTTVSVRYDNGEKKELVVSKSKEHI